MSRIITPEPLGSNSKTFKICPPPLRPRWEGDTRSPLRPSLVGIRLPLSAQPLESRFNGCKVFALSTIKKPVCYNLFQGRSKEIYQGGANKYFLKKLYIL